MNGFIRLSIAIIASTFAVPGAVQARDHGLQNLDCVAQPSEVIDLSSSVSGLISHINVDRSDFVNIGDVVAQLESSVEIADAQLSAEQAQTNTAINLRKAALTLGYKTKKRNEGLMNKSLISAQDVDKLDTDIRIAELNLALEKENKRLAQIASTRTNALLERRKVKSPINGFIVDRYKAVGERSNDDPILRIAQLDPLHIEVIVPSQHFSKITTGMHATVRNKNELTTEYQATVERIDKVLDAASGTFGVRLTVPNPDYTIPAGVLCTLEFQLND